MVDQDPGPGKSEIVTPRYELSSEELDALTSELIDERTDGFYPRQRFVSVAVKPQEPASNIARHIEREVFEKRFPSNNAEFMARAYGPYEEASTFFIVLDREKRKAASTLRVVENSPAGFITLNDLEEFEEFNVPKQSVIEAHGLDNLDEVLDVATVARADGYKKDLKATTFAYRSMFIWAESQGIKHLISMIDERPFLKMRDWFGIPFKPIKGTHPGPYMDSPKSYPVIGYVPEFIEKMKHHMFTKNGLLAHAAMRTMVLGKHDKYLSVIDSTD